MAMALEMSSLIFMTSHKSQHDCKGLCNKYVGQELDGKFSHHHEPAAGGMEAGSMVMEAKVSPHVS